MPWPGTRVFALELKRETRRNRKPTAHENRQEETRQRLAEYGCDTGVAYGLDEALAWLEPRPAQEDRQRLTPARQLACLARGRCCSRALELNQLVEDALAIRSA